MAYKTEFLGNIRGRQGVQGKQGLRGFPGAADVPTDPAMAAIIGAADSETFASAELSLQAFGRHIHRGHKIAERWGAAANRVQTGTGFAKVLCIGDSTTAGIGSSGSYANEFSYPSEMARNMHRTISDTIYGLSIPPSTNKPDSDPRWVLGAGWTHATETGVGIGGTAYKAGPGIGKLEFLDARIGADRYDIYFTKTGSAGVAGTITAQVGSGTPVVQSTYSAEGSSIGVITVSGVGPSSTVPVSITNSGSTGTVWILGVEPWSSGRNNLVRVANAGVSGSTTGGWLAKNSSGSGEPSSAWNVLGFLPVYQPDLTIIDLGINDAGSPTPVVDYISRIQTLADAAYAAGSAVLIKTMIPSSGARAVREAEYVAALKTSLSPAYAVLDLFSHYGTWERTNARGWMADWGHGTDGMYADEGALVAEMLSRYSDPGPMGIIPDTGWQPIGPLENGFTAVPGSEPAYRIIGGIVYLSGQLHRSTAPANEQAFILPSVARPRAALHETRHLGWGFFIEASPAGYFRITATSVRSSGTGYTLDGISYPAN